MNVFTHEDTGLPAVMVDGEPKLLACLQTDPQVRQMFRSYADLKHEAPEVRNISFRDQFSDMFLLNQRSHGSCVGFSSAGALMECRAMAGYTFQRLSGAYTYSFINGGRDQGASIGDSLNSLQKNGTCLESTVGWDEIYRNATKKGDEEAKRFKIDEGYRIESYDEALQAIMNGFVIVYAVMVGSSFDSLDSEDVVGYDRGPGNHAVHANGIYISQKWGPCLDSRNSWGSWGKNGWFRTARKHWESVQQDAYAIRAAAFDPNDPKQPRVAN